ncbi:MAG: hypothetical protein ABIR34_11605 [Marmoricola sp.]
MHTETSIEIPRPESVTDADRAELGRNWLEERNRMLAEGGGTLEQVRAHFEGS